MRGGSPGKAVFGLRVVTVGGRADRHRGTRSSGRRSAIVDFLIPPGGLVGGVVVALLATGPAPRRPRRRHDRPARAHRRPPRPWRSGSTRPPGWRATRQSLDVSAVTDAQFAVVRSFLLRVHDLVARGPGRPGVRLATPLATAMQHQPPPGRPPRAVPRVRGGRLPAPPRWPRHRRPRRGSRPRLLPWPRRPRRPRRPRPPSAPLSAPPAEASRPPWPARLTARPVWHYLDHAATTPMRPEALAAMVPLLQRRRRQPVRRPRARARRPGPRSTAPASSSPRWSGAEPGEVVFTGGGTEADNLAVRGRARARRGHRRSAAPSSTTPCSHPVAAAGGRTVPGRPARRRRPRRTRGQPSTPTSRSCRWCSSTTRSARSSPSTPSPRSSATGRPGALLHTDAAQAL